MTDDLKLQRAVADALATAVGDDAARIGVSIAHGVATLHGTTHDEGKRLRALYAAENVAGVRAVIDATQLRSAEQAMFDAELADQASSALRAEPALAANSVKVRVENGWLTMDGWVNSEEERQAARRALRHLFGIRGLSNLVRVAPRHDRGASALG